MKLPVSWIFESLTTKDVGWLEVFQQLNLECIDLGDTLTVNDFQINLRERILQLPQESLELVTSENFCNGIRLRSSSLQAPEFKALVETSDLPSVLKSCLVPDVETELGRYLLCENTLQTLSAIDALPEMLKLPDNLLHELLTLHYQKMQYSLASSTHSIISEINGYFEQIEKRLPDIFQAFAKPENNRLSESTTFLFLGPNQDRLQQKEIFLKYEAEYRELISLSKYNFYTEVQEHEKDDFKQKLMQRSVMLYFLHYSEPILPSAETRTHIEKQVIEAFRLLSNAQTTNSFWYGNESGDETRAKVLSTAIQFLYLTLSELKENAYAPVEDSRFSTRNQEFQSSLKKSELRIALKSSLRMNLSFEEAFDILQLTPDTIKLLSDEDINKFKQLQNYFQILSRIEKTSPEALEPALEYQIGTPTRVIARKI